MVPFGILNACLLIGLVNFASFRRLCIFLASCFTYVRSRPTVKISRQLPVCKNKVNKMIRGLLVGILLYVCIITLSGIPKTTVDPGSANIAPFMARNASSPSKLLSCAAVVVNLQNRFWHYKQPIQPKCSKSLLHLTILLLSISCDVESNPGPCYPCGGCGVEVLETDPAVECDSCAVWFHLQCQALDRTWYENIINTEMSFTWSCLACDNLNHSSASSILTSSIRNSFSILSNPSSPETEQVSQHKRKNKQAKLATPRLHVMLVNCQSILNKNMSFKTS